MKWVGHGRHGRDARRTPQGVRGLKCRFIRTRTMRMKSHPARGAWIEMGGWKGCDMRYDVAPRKGCVD